MADQCPCNYNLTYKRETTKSLKCENAIDRGRPFEQSLSTEEWLKTLAERIGTEGRWKRAKEPVLDTPATLPDPEDMLPSGMELVDMEFDDMQSSITRLVATGKLSGLEAMRMGQQIEAERTKRKAGIIAGIAAKSSKGLNSPGYATFSPNSRKPVVGRSYTITRHGR